MSITISDIARAAGVGRTTVFRALKGEGYVSPEKRARILEIARELNYRPNPIARSLITGRSDIIGMMATPYISADLGDVISQVETAVSDAGYSLMYYATDGGLTGERMCADQLMQMRVAGAFAFPDHDHAAREPYEKLIASGTKLVVWDRPIKGLKAPQLYIDHYQAAKSATQHLISLGHREIVIIIEPGAHYPGPERAKGFADAMVEAGICVQPGSIIPCDGSDTATLVLLRDLIGRAPRPTGLITRHITDAVSAMRVADAAGISVPEDLSIIANGDTWFTDWLRTPLTTVKFPVEAMVEIGIRKLLDMLNGCEVDTEPEGLKTELVIRGSTAPRV